MSGIILIISLLTCLLSPQARAQSDRDWRQHIEQQLLQQWRQQTGIRDDASISFIGISHQYQLPQCQLPLTIDALRPPLAGRNNIAIRCDAPYWVQNMAIQLHHMTNMVTLKRPLASDQVITNKDVRLARLDAGEQTKGYYAAIEQVLGQKAKRSLRPGTVLSEDMLSLPDLIQRRQRVTIQVDRPGIRVEMPGEALSSGHLGESIRVRNLQSRRIVEATVVEAGLVQVR
ncbi:flagellar basal body P-ring formation chaperone FlgA [Bacterioplanes sanyensis]|nr:flagellar basal body P-ring formation chaperone FlgA [Bacterioplanes sanyensis]